MDVENSVNVKTLQALAFGEYQEEDGGINQASTADEEDALDILVSNLGIAPANGTYHAVLGQNYPVASARSACIPE